MMERQETVLSIDLQEHAALQTALAAALQFTDETIGAGHLLLACLATNDDLAHLASTTLRPGASLDELPRVLGVQVGRVEGRESEGCEAARERDVSFDAHLGGALFELGQILDGAPNQYSDSVVEVLVDCLLRQIDVSEQSLEKVLDVELLHALLRNRVARQLHVAGETDDGRQEIKPDPPETAKSDTTEFDDGERRAVRRKPVGNEGRFEQKSASESATSDERYRLPSAVAPCEDLTFRVRQAESPAELPFEGDPRYERLFTNILRVLHRRQTHHVLLVGERGVGQSSVLAELARRGAVGEFPLLAERRVVTVSCRFIPPEETRKQLVGILNDVGQRDDLVVCLENMANLLKTAGVVDNKPVLFSMLQRTQCRLIGLMEPREYDELVAGDLDMQEFFQRVDIEPPDLETATKLMCHFAAGLESQFQVRIQREAVTRAVVLSENYIFSERLPSKALRILKQVCENVDFERSYGVAVRHEVNADDVVAAVSEASGVPEQTLRGVAERCDYEASLGRMIVGQPHAVHEVATELGLIKAGLTDSGKPASVMLLVGQTGTGKTELAKALARLYSTSKRLKTYTLGNFAEPHSVAGIIGVPAGYVGHDAGGSLINDLNADPYSVFLLDEADKAHPDVLQPFLNLFDEGWVVDQRGVKAYADRSIFILTTNVGQKMIADMYAKGETPDAIAIRIKEALSQIKHSKSNRPVFTPEFLARLKRVIVFQPLSKDAMQGICRNLIEQMQQTWRQNREKSIDVADDVVEYLAATAHEKNQASKGKEGGRIVRKLLSDLIEARVQREITNNVSRYQQCSTVFVRMLKGVDGVNGDEREHEPEIEIEFAGSA